MAADWSQRLAQVQVSSQIMPDDLTFLSCRLYQTHLKDSQEKVISKAAAAKQAASQPTKSGNQREAGLRAAMMAPLSSNVGKQPGLHLTLPIVRCCRSAIAWQGMQRQCREGLAKEQCWHGMLHCTTFAFGASVLLNCWTKSLGKSSQDCKLRGQQINRACADGM